MSDAARKLLRDVLALPKDERLELASQRLASVDRPREAGWCQRKHVTNRRRRATTAMLLRACIGAIFLLAGCVATKEPPPALETKPNVATWPASLADADADDASTPPPPLPTMQDAAAAGAPDPCAAPAERSERGCAGYTFVGELLSTKDDQESGYAHALRLYQFRRVQAWGPAPREIYAVVFLPNRGEPNTTPRLVVHQRYMIVLAMGGHSNCMPMIASATPLASAAKSISALGPACDPAALPE